MTLFMGRALKLPPEQVAALISADLFCCGHAQLGDGRALTGGGTITFPPESEGIHAHQHFDPCSGQASELDRLVSESAIELDAPALHRRAGGVAAVHRR